MLVVISPIRKGTGSRPTSPANGVAGGDSQYGSPVSTRQLASRIAALSRTERVSACNTVSPPQPSPPGAMETRPRDGLKPNNPQHDAGMRIEPPPSLACAAGTIPAATADADPPDEPPQVNPRFHGLSVAPQRSGSVMPTSPNSGVFAFPKITNPARL